MSTAPITVSTYTTKMGDTILYEGTDLPRAVRCWDAETSRIRGTVPGVHSGIEVVTHSDGTVIREGWVLHVHPSGQVYLNPNIVDQGVGIAR